MKIPKIISLAGWKGHGKNTAADYLTEKYGYTQIAFADALREKCMEFVHDYETVPKDMPTGILAVLQECRREYRETVREVDNAELYYLGEYVRRFVYQKPTPACVRKLLQLVGTEYYREKDRSYWIKSIHLDPDKHYVFTDCRFFDEADLCLAYGALLWTIYRTDSDGVIVQSDDLHASEVQIPSLYSHHQIHNQWGNKGKMYEELDRLVTQLYNPGNIVMMDWSA